jgi:ribosomal protein S18 acetylase RimI-like enzyme
MRRELPGGFELDDDPGRVDVAAVHDFLANHSYWARGRPRDVVERLVREATRVVGLYRGNDQVGCARVVSDGEVFAYLLDVYVLPEFRGRGLGVEIVREAVDRGPQRDLRWLLGTADANELYAKFGFGPVSSIMMERLPVGGNAEP